MLPQPRAARGQRGRSRVSGDAGAAGGTSAGTSAGWRSGQGSWHVLEVLQLARVAHDDVRLDRLLQLYMHEWSARVATLIGSDARYTYRDLAAWTDRERHAAYLFLDDAPVGFALVARDLTETWHVEEFFVIAGVRRRGAGAIAAHALFAAHGGPWTWTVRPEHPAALAFWRRVAPDARVSAEHGGDGITRTRMRLGG